MRFQRFSRIIIFLFLFFAFVFAASSPAFAENFVKINGYVIDVKGQQPAVPKELEATADGRFKKWIVQFSGPVHERDKKNITDLGGRIGDYLPEFAFIVTMNAKTKAEIEALPFVKGAVRYKPAYKIDSRLKDATGAVAAEKGKSVKLHVRVDFADNLSLVLSEVLRGKGRVLNVGKDVAMVEIDGSNIARLAKIEEVVWIEKAVDMKLQNDTTKWVIQTNVENNTKIWDKGLHGENQVVGIGDTGLDYDMVWFRDPSDSVPIGLNHRKIIGYDSSYGDSSDADDPGHGTHVAGTIAGDRTPVDGLSSANGMAPKTKIYIQDLTAGSDTQVNPPSDLGLMFTKAYDAGARIHNDSWGGYDNAYGSLAMTADRFLWEHKDFLALFANGNTGPNPNTVLNPATAKNVISVGATLNGSSADNVTDFSANGLTADGRIKPTVTAPGDGVMERSGIISADSDGQLSTKNSGTIAMRGTSMATAAVSGAAALVRQYFMDGYYPSGAADSADAFTPSASLIKAVIVNSAQNMAGNYTGGTIPGTGQGWGRVNLSNTLEFTGDAKPLAVVDNTSGLNTGESWSQMFFSPGDQPVKVTLVWTDYPGSSEASTALVNDLDLSVTAPDGTTTYRGNVILNGVSASGGSPDRLNVEEQVLMPSAVAGSYTITVNAYNVPNGPQPFAVVIVNVSNVTSKGSIQLDRSKYNASRAVNIKVGDRDLNLDNSVIEETYVTIKSTSEQGGETIKLMETGPDTAVFTGSLSLSTAPSGTNDGVLTIADGDTITAVYNDANDGTGNPATATATATVDLIPPTISSVATSALTEVSATVTWATNEAADSKISYGETQSRGTDLTDSLLYTQHTFTVTNLKEGKTYYYSVSSTDEAGNTATDNNNGSLYSFTTPTLPPSLTVNSSEGSQTYNASTVIYGVSTDASGISSVTVNGAAASYRGSDGYYELSVDLAIGDNLLNVVTTDNAGNTQELTITVTRLNTPDLFAMPFVTETVLTGTGSSFSVAGFVCNQGAGDSPAFSVGFYLSSGPTVTTSDIHFEDQDQDIVSLQSGTCTAIAKTLTVPQNIPQGNYYIGAIADYKSSVIESDETNNGATGSQIQVEAPDLAPTVASGPDTGSTGNTITIKNTVKNNASKAKSSGFYVDLYLSLDSSVTTTDIHLGSRYVDSLNAGAESTADTTVTIPGNIAGATYYIGVIVDAFKQVTESTTDNNSLAGNQIAVAGTDLTMTNLSGPSTALTGGVITVNNTVTASASGGSTGGFYVGIYLSTHATVTTDDTLIAYRWVNSLAPGTSSTEYTQVTIPTYIAPGTYYLGAIADYSGVVVEPDETNNTLAGNQITVTGADLTMTAVSGPASAIPGGTITVANTAKASSAGGSAGNFSVGIYLSTDPVITTSDIFVGSRSVSSLASGEATTDSTALTIPADVQSGTYYIGAIADYTNAVRESDETNNSLAGNQIEILKPDLSMTALSTQVSAKTGDTITVSNTVAASANGAAAGSFTVGIYLSTDSTITTDDILLAERQLSSLASGASSTTDTTITLPTSLAGGTYYIGAIADNHNSVIESDETNNARTGNQITITGPDLIMTSVSGPTSALTGDSVTVTDSVTASANGGTAGDFTVGIYLSTDPAITTSDTLIGQRVVHGLIPGQTSSGETAVTIPVSVAGGVYYIGAIADYANAVPDSNTANNALAGNQITISGPDLIETSVSGPSTGVTGQTITVSDTVTASASGGSAGTFSVGIYLSKDSTITTSDILLDSHYVSGLAPGGSYSSSTVVTIPGDLAAGTYYIGAIADAYGQVSEANKTNNALAGNQITVTQALPDLAVTSLTGPNSAATDDQITVTGVVRNQGLAPAGPSWASVYLSTDSTITTGDIFLGDVYVGDLAVGAEQTVTAYVTIPSNIAGGTYYIGLIADRTGQVAESNETNNSFAGNQIAITKLYPDLVVTSVSGPTSGVIKQPITVTVTVKNQGAVASAASYVGIYLSPDQTVTTGDVYLGQASISALDPGTDQTINLSVTLPRTSQGTFYIGAIADRLNTVAESDETNNGMAGNQIVITR